MSFNNDSFGSVVRRPRDGPESHRDGREMATGQYRSALSFDDVVQKSILAGSTLQNSFERISKPLEEQCGEFVPLVSLRF